MAAPASIHVRRGHARAGTAEREANCSDALFASARLSSSTRTAAAEGCGYESGTRRRVRLAREDWRGIASTGNSKTKPISGAAQTPLVLAPPK
jgi:hypothetical protein